MNERIALCASWLNAEGYAHLLAERARLTLALGDAPSNSSLAHRIIDEISVVAEAIDAYEQLHPEACLPGGQARVEAA